MISRAVVLLALLAALAVPLVVEAQLLPPVPKLRSLTCDPRSCTLAWKVEGDGRWGAALLAPATGQLLQVVPGPGVAQVRVTADDWRPGQPIEVVEWGEGWERRTRWAPALTYFPRVEG